jgi:hypothetical protein
MIAQDQITTIGVLLLPVLPRGWHICIMAAWLSGEASYEKRERRFALRYVTLTMCGGASWA